MIQHNPNLTLSSLSKEQGKKFSEFLDIISKVWNEKFSSLSSEEGEYYTETERLSKFFVAREHKIDPALEMWKNWVEWRIKTGPNLISADEIPNELALRKALWLGEDKKGHPSMVVKISRTDPDADPKEVVKYGLYMLEQGIQEAEKRGSSHFVVMIDKKGLSRKLMGAKMTGVMKELLGVLQNYYPERLSKLYILNANWLFKVLYTILKPFIDSKTKKKICFVTNNDDLLKDFSPEHLLKEYGGILEEGNPRVSGDFTIDSKKGSEQSINIFLKQGELQEQYSDSKFLQKKPTMTKIQLQEETELRSPGGFPDTPNHLQVPNENISEFVIYQTRDLSSRNPFKVMK